MNADGGLDAQDLAAFLQCMAGPFVLLDPSDPCLAGDFALRFPITFDGVQFVGGDGVLSMADMLAFQVAAPKPPPGPTTSPPVCLPGPIATRHIGWEVGDTSGGFRRMNVLFFQMDDRFPTLCTSATIPTGVALWGGMACEFLAGTPGTPDPVATPPFLPPPIGAFWVQSGAVMTARGFPTVLGGPSPTTLSYYFETSAILPTDTTPALIAANYSISFGPGVVPTPGSASTYMITRDTPFTGTPSASTVTVTDQNGVPWPASRVQTRFNSLNAVLRWNHGAFNAETKNWGDEVPGHIQVCVPNGPVNVDLMKWTNMNVMHDTQVAFVPLLPQTYGNIHHSRNPSPVRWSAAATDGGGSGPNAVFIGHY